MRVWTDWALSTCFPSLAAPRSESRSPRSTSTLATSVVCELCNNDNLAISSIHGTCQSDGSCVCSPGYSLLASGKYS